MALAFAAFLAIAAPPAFAMQIFVSNEKDNTVTVIDGDTLEVTKTIKTARRPRGIIASPDGKEFYVACGDGEKLYVANGLTNDMTVIDVDTLKAEKSVKVGRLPWGVAIVP